MVRSSLRFARVARHAVGALLLLATAPAVAGQAEPDQQAAEASHAESSAAPKTPALAPLLAIGMGVLLAAGLSLEKAPLSARRAARR